MPAAGLRFGWLGTGRRGFLLATRLLRGGHEVVVCNRTWVHVEPLLALGARIADRPEQLADQDVVITTAATGVELVATVLGPHGLLTRPGHTPMTIVDCSAAPAEATEQVRLGAERAGTRLIVAGKPAEAEEFAWLLEV